jgi:ABC-type transport system involved in Fe-S cluster assembly fused permease/ATPase subunit
MEQEKVTVDELNAIKQIKTDYSVLVNNVGEIELQISNLKKTKENYLKAFETISEREEKLIKELQSKYGDVSIDLETGSISK